MKEEVKIPKTDWYPSMLGFKSTETTIFRRPTPNSGSAGDRGGGGGGGSTQNTTDFFNMSNYLC